MTEYNQNLCYNCFQERDSSAGPCPYCGFDLAENEKKYPVALRAGTVLNDRYIVGRVLGQGGFGITYLAWDTQLEAKVAIKEFMPNEIATRIGTTVSVAVESRSEDFTYGSERFQEEARTLAKFIGNPNIAAVTSYFDENDTSYFVMDYIEGISFKTYIANHGGKVSVEDTLNVMIPVLRALTAVHQEGFIHRDVTPDNIYITKDGMVKLLDFGSARYSIGDKSKSLDVILKVGYAPKEQYIRRSRQGPYTDVYSCAACFYAALTGFLPPEALERLDRDELVPVSQCGIDIPEYLDKAILKGLAVQPEDRFQSAEEFLNAIESQQVVEVPQAGAAQPAAPAKKKLNPVLIGGAAAAVIAVVIGFGVMGGGGNPVTEALAPTITIAGQQVSAADNFLELVDGTLTDADIAAMKQMGNLQRIYLEGVSIETDGLAWVAEFPQLTEFSCEGYLTDELDLTPFAGLTELTRLSFYQNNTAGAPAGDLSPLAGLTKMERLDLCIGFDVKDISSLSGLTQLEELQLYSTNSNNSSSSLTNISALSGMTQLTSLRLNLGHVEDFSPLSGLTQLQELRMYGSFIVDDLSFLRELTELRSLDISGSYEGAAIHQDLSDLSQLTKLTELRLDIPVASLSGLENLTDLRELLMYGSDSTYTDVDPLAKLTKLQVLRLPMHGNNPAPFTIDGLANLTQLTELDMECSVASLEPLRNLTNLRVLSMRNGSSPDGTSFSSLEPLAGLTGLVELSIRTPQGITDLSPLSGLTNLRTLYLDVYGQYDDPPLTDISALGNLASLQSLTLQERGLTDLSPLSNCTKLQTLTIYEGGEQRITDLSPVSHVPNVTIE